MSKSAISIDCQIWLNRRKQTTRPTDCHSLELSEKQMKTNTCTHSTDLLAFTYDLTAAMLFLVVASLAPQAQCSNEQNGANESFLETWQKTAAEAKESQPHWITPLVTVTPRLEQEFRYDQTWQAKPDAVSVTNYGGGKGLELIPTSNTEVIIGVPSYITKDTPKGTSNGWADESITVKYRAAAANEEQGNYIVTGFLGVSVPTGNKELSNEASIYTPTIAAGKGWGNRMSGFDIQSTLGLSIPDTNRNTIGVPVLWNTAFQWHYLQYFWPEIEVNYTHWREGPNDGKTQTSITTGMVFGRFPISSSVNLIVGTGYQQTVTSFRTYEHTWVSTTRVTF